MKLVSKIAIVGALLMSGATAASAQNTGRPAIDNPTRNWNSGLMTGPSYYGFGEAGPYGAFEDHNNYGVSSDHIWATPQNDNYNDHGS